MTEKVYVHTATKTICVTRAVLDCPVSEGKTHNVKKYYRLAGYRSVPVAYFKRLIKAGSQ